MPDQADTFEVRLHLRHVGLGNAVLLELPDDKCAVIDWGTTDQLHHQYLLDLLGDRQLAFVAATHGHEDHTAGLPWLFRQMLDLEQGQSRIRRYITPLAEELHYEPIKAVAENLAEFWTRNPRLGPARNVTICEPSYVEYQQPPVLVEAGKYRLVALYPPEHVRAKSELLAAVAGKKSGNLPSLVLLLQLAGGQASVLFGGDAQEPAWNMVRQVVNDWPDVEPVGPVTVVSHHGASPKQGMPGWAVERFCSGGLSLLSTPSADEDHPNAKTLKSLCKVSASVCCTSYAEVCRRKYKKTQATITSGIVQDEPCFGNMVVTVKSDGSWEVDHDGAGERKWGYCQ